MNVCSECKEPDYPLDDKTGLCYTCWTLAGMPEVYHPDAINYCAWQAEEEE